MTEVCVIGDSHVAALRRATHDGSLPKLTEKLVYFSAHIDVIKRLRLQGRSMVADDDDDELRGFLAQLSGKRTSIEIDLYDQFVIIGHGFGIPYLVQVYRANCCDSIPDPTGKKYRLSDNCFMAAAEDEEMRTQAMRIARLIRLVTDKPITVVPMPNPGAGLPESDMPPGAAPFHEAVRNGDADALGALFCRLCEKIARDLDIRIIPPPAEVAENGVFIRREFSRLPDDLDGLTQHQRLGSMFHANGRYGAVVARKLFAIPPASQ